MGRYHYWRLHPFTLTDLPESISPENGLKRLMTVGGFPEPFLENDERFAKRWRRERIDRVLKLERMYLIFVVRPYTVKIPRAIQKPPKVYFFNNGDVLGDEGARFENLVATHLLKSIHFLEVRDGDSYELNYIRDKEGREVDFVILKNKRVEALIEAKYSDGAISSSLSYYIEKLKPRIAVQVVNQDVRSFERNGIRVESALEFLMKIEEKLAS